jgi:hypothetical protein
LDPFKSLQTRPLDPSPNQPGSHRPRSKSKGEA